jgi:hypothetical protein
MMDFNISMDPGSLSALTQLQGFAGLLNPAVVEGLRQSGVLLVNAAQANTWNVFANPTGDLADSIYFYVISPTEVAVAVGVPYGRRRENGYSGFTDALGRYYPNDPAKPYLTPAVDDNTQEIQEIMEMAMNTALGRIAA